MNTEKEIIEQKVQHELTKLKEQPAPSRWIPRHEFTAIPDADGVWNNIPRSDFNDDHAQLLIEHFTKLGKGNKDFDLDKAIDTQMYRA